MKIRNTAASNALLLALVLTLSGCGGGGGGGADSPGDDITTLPGGTAAAPATMSLDQPNEINASAFNNYFNITVAAGDTVVIKSTLASVLSDQNFARCSSNTSAYYTGIRLIGGSTSCSLNFRQTFASAGTYTFQFGYPDGNFGLFEAARIPVGADLTPLSNASGRPDDPRTLNITGADNLFYANDFYNHFAYDANAGDTLFLQAFPDVTPSGTDQARCTSGAPYENYYSYGVQVDGTGDYSCGVAFERRFEQAGRYFLNLRYKKGARGTFRVVVTPALR